MERLHTLKHVRDLSFPQSFCKRFKVECELLQSMLAVDPASRPSAAEILDHDLVTKHKSQDASVSRRARTISITETGDST